MPSLSSVITRKQLDNDDCGKGTERTGSPLWATVERPGRLCAIAISVLRIRKQVCGLVCSILALIEFRILLLLRFLPLALVNLNEAPSLPPSPCSPPRLCSGRTKGSTMVAFPPLLARDGVGIPTNFTYPAPTPPSFLAICAYPLSGQYGPGTRYLYYGLVAVCIFARKHEWLREPCLAAALLFPALSSIHAIIMACYSDSGKYHSISLYYSH